MELWDFYGNPHTFVIPISMLPRNPEATGGGNAEPAKDAPAPRKRPTKKNDWNEYRTERKSVEEEGNPLVKT
jgi:hypothetical protein